MKTFLIGTFVLITLAGVILLFNDYYVKRKFRKLALQKYKIVEPLIQKLAANKRVSEAEVMTMAEDPSLRHAVFRALEVYNRRDLFPEAYFTIEKGAESFLVNWLEFPTELGRAPDEIVLLEKVTIKENEILEYYVFKYRTKSPHWAAHNNWMIGVSGPYKKESHPYDVPLRVYSRFTPIDFISPESEVQWVHANISQIPNENNVLSDVSQTQR